MRRNVLGATALALVALCAHLSASQSTAPQAPAASAPDVLTITPGQKFIMRLETAIHTNSTRKGDRVEFSTAADLMVDNQVAVPDRSEVRATVTKAKRAGRLAGRAEVQLRIDEIKLADGSAYPVRATIIRVGFDPVSVTGAGDPRLKGDSGSGGDMGTVVKAGAQGALIGVLMSASLKGAMYGSAAAAAITLAGMVLKRGPDLDLPRDTMFEARFDKPLAIPVAVSQRAAQAGGSRPLDARADTSTPADEAMSRPRPVLRRPQRGEAPPVDNPADTQPPVGTTTNPPPGVDTKTDPQPPMEAPANSQSPVETATIPPHPEAAPAAPSPSAPTSGNGLPADPGAFKMSVNVRMVLVDAVVRDRAGRLMDNLKREDFRVYEDGVEQEILSYSRDALPLAVALVVDRSGSVAPYINELRRIAYRALQQLKPGDEVALFSFASTVDRLEDLTTDRQRIADGVARIRAGGSTDIIDALYDAESYLANVAAESRRAVILISDNQPTVHPYVSEGETIRTAMETETVIYSLKTSGESTPLALRLPNLLSGAGSVNKVAQESGGEVINVTDVSMLDAALGGIIARLRLRYALGYSPPDQGRGGAFHSIEVRLADRLGRPGADYFIHARRGYYATGDRSTRKGTP